MLDLALVGFIGLMLALGLRRPFFWVLAYIYIDVVAPQKIGWGFIQSLPVSLIAFAAAFAGWLFLDNKHGSRFTLRQALITMVAMDRTMISAAASILSFVRRVSGRNTAKTSAFHTQSHLVQAATG